MNRPPKRLTRTVAVAAAGVAVGLATTYTVAGVGGEEGPRTSRPVAQAHVADWAREHRRSGLSPASLGASTTAASPASVELADVLSQLADFAREHDLSGLSPASLHPVAD